MLTIWADDNNEIAPHRVTQLLRDADKMGGDSAPLELVAANGPNDRWGLRIRILGNE